VGQVEHDEGLRDGLHPGPGDRDQLAEEEQPVVALPQGRDHLPWAESQAPHRPPYASFSDPDGNLWLLHEITKRLPGRTWEADPTDVAARAALLKDTAIHHGSFEAVAPPHDWWDWYAAYMLARQAGNGEDEAAATANRYMAEVKHVVVSSA